MQVKNTSFGLFIDNLYAHIQEWSEQFSRVELWLYAVNNMEANAIYSVLINCDGKDSLNGPFPVLKRIRQYDKLNVVYKYKFCIRLKCENFNRIKIQLLRIHALNKQIMRTMYIFGTSYVKNEMEQIHPVSFNNFQCSYIFSGNEPSTVYDLTLNEFTESVSKMKVSIPITTMNGNMLLSFNRMVIKTDELQEEQPNIWEYTNDGVIDCFKISNVIDDMSYVLLAFSEYSQIDDSKYAIPKVQIEKFILKYSLKDYKETVENDSKKLYWESLMCQSSLSEDLDICNKIRVKNNLHVIFNSLIYNHRNKKNLIRTIKTYKHQLNDRNRIMNSSLKSFIKRMEKK